MALAATDGGREWTGVVAMGFEVLGNVIIVGNGWTRQVNSYVSIWEVPFD